MKSAAVPNVARRLSPTPRPFPVAGIGASAGGLEALEAFFAHVAPDCGMAFVVVTHQHPGHSSLLPELLRKFTRMRVLVAVDGVAVEPDCVYMSPSEGYLAILNGTLHQMEPDEPGVLRLPIDYFFRSLAEDQKERAVGIILSGTGTDGTLGLKAIKGAAGMTMAQAPESAKYSGMPSSAIATGLVDYVLPAEQMPAQLRAYAQGPHLALAANEALDEKRLPDPMQKVNVLLRARTGHDFSAYKANTIRRRIERRINVHQLKGPQQYLRYLHENPHELDLLFRDLLIGVTNFFRDPEAFAALTKAALPGILAPRPHSAPVRVWAPGCSTGEEAYSLAMLLREQMDHANQPLAVQIFATDLDHKAVEAARGGLYPEGIAGDVRPQRLARFFVKEDEGYRIKKEIREMVVFAPQNILKDPPFTKIDLVVCRNLLIYLRQLLEEVLPKRSAFEGFEVDHVFPGLGRKVLLLNARRLEQEADLPGMVLLAVEEVKASAGRSGEAGSVVPSAPRVTGPARREETGSRREASSTGALGETRPASGDAAPKEMKS